MTFYRLDISFNCVLKYLIPVTLYVPIFISHQYKAGTAITWSNGETPRRRTDHRRLSEKWAWLNEEDIDMYRPIYNISLTKIATFNFVSSHLAVEFEQSIEARCKIENEYVVGATPTGDAPTTFEWSTVLPPTNVPLVLDICRFSRCNISCFRIISESI